MVYCTSGLRNKWEDTDKFEILLLVFVVKLINNFEIDPVHDFR